MRTGASPGVDRDAHHDSRYPGALVSRRAGLLILVLFLAAFGGAVFLFDAMWQSGCRDSCPAPVEQVR